MSFLILRLIQKNQFRIRRDKARGDLMKRTGVIKQ